MSPNRECQARCASPGHREPTPGSERRRRVLTSPVTQNSTERSLPPLITDFSRLKPICRSWNQWSSLDCNLSVARGTTGPGCIAVDTANAYFKARLANEVEKALEFVSDDIVFESSRDGKFEGKEAFEGSSTKDKEKGGEGADRVSLARSS